MNSYLRGTGGKGGGGGDCFSWLKPQNRVKDCELTKKFKHCRKKHHQSICDKVTSDRLQHSPECPMSNDSVNSETTANNTSNSGGLQLLLIPLLLQGRI